MPDAVPETGKQKTREPSRNRAPDQKQKRCPGKLRETRLSPGKQARHRADGPIACAQWGAPLNSESYMCMCLIKKIFIVADSRVASMGIARRAELARADSVYHWRDIMEHTIPSLRISLQNVAMGLGDDIRSPPTVYEGCQRCSSALTQVLRGARIENLWIYRASRSSCSRNHIILWC